MLILASNSPRRRELLETAGYKFKVVPALSEEVMPPLKPQEAAIEIARIKAVEVALSYPDDVILAADTMVVLGDEVMGKPRDEADAFNMLKALSGKQHEVITGVYINKSSQEYAFFGQTTVEFYDLSNEEIKTYIKTGEPFDKAGAYGIQQKGALLIRGIVGDYFNVMGLPIAQTSRVLKKFLL